MIIGATGSIGGACAQWLAPHFGRMVFVARNATRLSKWHESIDWPCPTQVTTDVHEAVPQGQVVLTATTSTLELIEPDDLQTGAVVCELSLPHDVGRRVADQRPDVLVIEGGNMRVPGEPSFERVREPGTQFDLGLPRGTALACMSEAMVLALSNRLENYTLGRGIELERIREIDELAAGAGFTLADMRAFDRAITAADVAAARRAAHARRASARVAV